MIPKVSVILPNYNYARYLEERIKGILDQTFQDFELILLDDASTDDSRTILESYRAHPKISHVEINSVNSGSVFKQWNKGVSVAKGEFIWIAEADDGAQPNLLEKLYSSVSKDGALAYCRSMIINENNEELGCAFGYLKDIFSRDWDEAFALEGPVLIRKALGSANLIPNASSALFKKNAYLACGGADESFRFFGDWDLWLKLAAVGDVSYCPEFLNFYRRHSESFTSKAPVLFAYGWYERLRIFRRVLDSGLLGLKSRFRQSLSLSRELFNVIHYAGISQEHHLGLVKAAWGTSSLLGFLLSSQDRCHGWKHEISIFRKTHS